MRFARHSLTYLTIMLALSACRSQEARPGVIVFQATATPPSALTMATPSPAPATATTLSPTPTTVDAPAESPLAVTSTATAMAAATPPDHNFDADQAFAYLEAQMELGPRWPGSPGHTAAGDLIVGELNRSGWTVEEQRFDYQGFKARNIIGRANQGRGNVIILGAHYDTRRLADQTPGAAEAGEPVPGAVDGASGVAVMLELGQSLDLAQISREIWLVFFDVEDNGRGGIPGWVYSAGSPALVDSLTVTPEAVVIVDMIGDADQQLYYEGNSDPELSQLLWSIAAGLGYNEFFIPTLQHTMLDDHLAFLQRGIRTALIIDFDYPYWHTVEDTLDKTSSDSLYRVGHTLEVWLENHLGE